MSTYSQFTVSELAMDDAFRQWVFKPDEQNMTFWHTFMLRHPEQQAAVDEAASILLHLRVTYDDLTDASQQRIGQILQEAAAGERDASTTPVLPLPVYSRQRFAWRVAASLTGLLLLAGGLVWYSGRADKQRIHTAFGENRTVALPDGSTVLLNSNSTLSFADHWSEGESREVWLEGEGYFKVAKKRRPAGQTPGAIKFITHTPTLDITVLGTQFNVNTRRGSTAVMLVEGRVQLSRPGQVQSARVVELRPGQLASAQSTIENITVQSAKPQLHTAWTQHEFIFENTPLSEIAQQFRDTYGLDIIIEDTKLANRRFTGNLSNQNAETILTALSITFDLNVRRDGARIILERNP